MSAYLALLEKGHERDPCNSGQVSCPGGIRRTGRCPPAPATVSLVLLTG
jgi:hypothetical protein